MGRMKQKRNSDIEIRSRLCSESILASDGYFSARFHRLCHKNRRRSTACKPIKVVFRFRILSSWKISRERIAFAWENSRDMNTAVFSLKTCRDFLFLPLVRLRVTLTCNQSWASKRFFPGEKSGFFPEVAKKIFQGAKKGEISIYSLETKRKMFFAKIY